MAPKFRGGSEDWLDEADRTQEKAKTRPKKGNVARSTDLQIEDTNAGVVEVFPNQCRVQMDDHSFLLCHYRRAEVVSKGQDGVRERTPVAVGDRVWVNSVSPSEGRVEGIAVRKNRISRPAPGRDGKKWQHVIAANIDLLVIVASAQEPPFSPGLVDRFSIGALVEKIPVLLCVAKTDLVGPTDPRPWQAYREIGYSLVETSVQGNVGDIW